MSKEKSSWAMDQLEIQRKQQEELLRLPEVPGISAAGLNQPADVISGDGYGIILNRGINFFIFDVEGHGPETLIDWTRAMTLMFNTITNGLSPLETAHHFAQWSEESKGEKLFVSAIVGKTDPGEKMFSYVHQGHTWPLIWSREKQDFVKIENGEDEYGNIKGSGMTVNTGMVGTPHDGVPEELNYINRKIPVDAGDVIVLYTDGITEAHDRDGQALGEKRLKEIIREVIMKGKKHADAAEIISETSKKLDQALSGIRREDDCSMLVMVIGEARQASLGS